MLSSFQKSSIKTVCNRWSRREFLSLVVDFELPTWRVVATYVRWLATIEFGADIWFAVCFDTPRLVSTHSAGNPFASSAAISPFNRLRVLVRNAHGYYGADAAMSQVIGPASTKRVCIPSLCQGTQYRHEHKVSKACKEFVSKCTPFS
jgi:hypothetical protein